MIHDLPEWLHRFFGGGDVRQTDKKIARVSAAQELIDRQGFGVEFSAGDVYAMNAILGTEFGGFKRFVNPRYPNDRRHVFALFPSGDWRDISWNRIISPKGETTRIHNALRTAVWQDLQDALDSIKPCACAHCGAIDNLSTDHAEKPFSQIANEWLAINGTPVLVDCESGGGKQFADIGQEASWVTFHAGNAVYQILCRSCNSSKGNRGEKKGESALATPQTQTQTQDHIAGNQPAVQPKGTTQ